METETPNSRTAVPQRPYYTPEALETRDRIALEVVKEIVSDYNTPLDEADAKNIANDAYLVAEAMLKRR